MKPRFAFLFLLCFLCAGCAAAPAAAPVGVGMLVATATADTERYGDILRADGALALTVVLVYGERGLVSHSAYYSFETEEQTLAAQRFASEKNPDDRAVAEGCSLTIYYADSPYAAIGQAEARAVLEAMGFTVALLD